MNKQPTHLSWSQINSFISCPRSWFVSKILGEEQISTDKAVRGNAFDQSVAVALGLSKPTDCDEYLKLQALTPEERAARRIDEAVNHYLVNGGWMRADEAQKEVRISKNQWETLKQLYDVDYELWLPIVGYIDLFRKSPSNPFEYQVCDLKTSEREEFRPSWSGQQALYCLATGASEFEIHLITFTKQIKLAKYGFRPTDRTYNWLMNLVGKTSQEMRQVATETAADRVTALAGYHCAWCSRSLNCEAALVGRLVKLEGK